MALLVWTRFAEAAPGVTSSSACDGCACPEGLRSRVGSVCEVDGAALFVDICWGSEEVLEFCGELVSGVDNAGYVALDSCSDRVAMFVKGDNKPVTFNEAQTCSGVLSREFVGCTSDLWPDSGPGDGLRLGSTRGSSSWLEKGLPMPPIVGSSVTCPRF
jgi:hypothetical protein